MQKNLYSPPYIGFKRSGHALKDLKRMVEKQEVDDRFWREFFTTLYDDVRQIEQRADVLATALADAYKILEQHVTRGGK